MVREYIDKNENKHFDDPTIQNSEGFLRHLNELWWHDNRLSSAAFGPEDISFCLESLISPSEFHDFSPTEGLFRLKASQLRELKEVLVRDPTGNLKWQKAHALSWGNRGNKTKKRKFSRMAEILYHLPKT